MNIGSPEIINDASGVITNVACFVNMLLLEIVPFAVYCYRSDVRISSTIGYFDMNDCFA